MQSLLALVTSIASGEALDAVARAKKAAVIYLIAGLLGAFGVIFLLVAGFIATAQEIGALEAALWFGGVFLGLAILIILSHRVVSSIRARRIAKRRNEEAKSIASAAAIALLPALLASRKGSIALVAPMIGLLSYAVYRENTRPGPLPPYPPRDEDPNTRI